MAESVLELRLVDRASPGLNKADANAKKLNKTVDSTSRKLQRGTASFFGFGKGATTAGNAALAATPKIVAMGAAMKTALGPIALLSGGIGAITGAIGGLASMDTAVAKFETLGGSGAELRKELIGVGKRIDGAASDAELAGAAYDVASAGFTDAADAAKILEVAAMGAQGGFSDLNTVGGATVKVLNAYGLAAKDASRLGDMFAQTQADGIITIGQYSQGIGKVASVASMLKVPLEEVNAVMALSTKAGVNAEVAFTGLKASLLRLAGERGGKKLEKYGIDINAATIASEGLLANLKKLEGLDTEALGAIFGQEAIQTMAPILNNMKEYEKLINNQKDSTGALKDANDRMANTVAGAWKRLTTLLSNAITRQSEFGELLQNIIDIATAGLKLVGFFLSPIVEWLNLVAKLVNQIKDAVVGLGKSLDERIPAWAKRWLGGESKPGEELKKGVEASKKTIDKIGGGAGGTTNLEGEADKVADAWREVGQIIESGVGSALKGVLKGTQTLAEGLVNILDKIADKLLDLALSAAFQGLGEQGGWLGALFKPRAAGGYVDKPELSLIGEGSEGEYVIPESKMGAALAKYAGGARGEDVLTPGGESSSGGASSGPSGSSAIDVRFSSTVINDVSYVTFEQFQAGVQQAAVEGAKRGEQGALRRLQTHPGIRRKVGV